MIIEVPPRIKEYEPYAYWLLGAPTTGFSARERVTPEQRLVRAWESMMARCYSTTHQAYVYYGGCGVSVCKRWHQVGSYIADVQLIHGWSSKLLDWDNFDLDKDYYSSNQYGPDTCVWLSRAENMSIRGRHVYVTSPFGSRTLELSTKAVERTYGITHANIWKAIQKGVPLASGKLRGYLFEYALDTSPNLRHPLT